MTEQNKGLHIQVSEIMNRLLNGENLDHHDVETLKTGRLVRDIQREQINKEQINKEQINKNKKQG